MRMMTGLERIFNAAFGDDDEDFDIDLEDDSDDDDDDDDDFIDPPMASDEPVT